MDKEPGIRRADRYQVQRQQQFGVDVIAEREGDDGIEVASCKCYVSLKKGAIRSFSDEFLDPNLRNTFAIAPVGQPQRERANYSEPRSHPGTDAVHRLRHHARALPPCPCGSQLEILRLAGSFDARLGEAKGQA